MVRVISANAQTQLDQNLGTEPIIIIEIQWVDGGSIYTYSDKDLGGTEGRILEVSGLDNTTVVQGVSSGTAGESQAISITVDDTDGSIKQIIDSHDIHKEPAWVYQSFQGLDHTTDKFLIFKGQISSPIQWNEGDRTVSFDILTRIEDAEVGFSMEEGDFDYVPEELVGQPWPLVFGTVVTCPALKTRTPRRGRLVTGFGIRDFMLAPKKEQASLVCCPWRFVGFRSFYEASASGGPWGVGRLVIQPVYEKDVRCECKKRAIQCEMDLKTAAQAQFEYGTVQIVDGDKFPQGQYIILDIQGARIGGRFNGTEESPTDIFTIANRIHPKRVNGEVTVPKIQGFGCDPRPTGNENSADQGVGTQVCILPSDCGGWGSTFGSANIIQDTGQTKEQVAWNYLSTFREAGFFWAEPGSEVTLVGDNEIVYIVNLLPATVHQIKAWRTFSASNLRQLTNVPQEYYTTRLSDFNGYTTTEVVFDRPLSSRGEGWEDDIFVTQTSSVGPNPVDIMEWLITKYTSFSWDATFADVKTKVDNYPMNFMVPGRKNILTLLQEMAWQGRMAMLLRNDEFGLVYLSEEPDEDGTITESDVLANSLVLDHTNTEELVTKFVAEWRPECHLEDPYKVILRYNVRRYGTQEETFDFYCYNIQELVIKSATFWLIRMANTWRKIICKTPVNKLALETLDGVFVTLADIADEEIKCRVENATYNSDDHTIDFVLQTPVRSGEKTAFPFHYPANISIEELHPTIEDLRFGNAGGSGPNVDVTAPEGHVLGKERQLAQGFSFGQKSPCESLSTGPNSGVFFRPVDVSGKCRPDQGDQQPSDTDDTKPEVPLEDDNGPTKPPSQSPTNEQTQVEIDQQAFELQQEGTNGDLGNQITNGTNAGTGANDGAGANGGAGSGGGPAEPNELLDQLMDMPDGEELEEQNKCHYAITLFFITPVTSVRIQNDDTCDGEVCQSSLGWCYCGESQKQGCWVGNQVPTVSETFYFGSESERDAAAEAMQDVINSQGIVGEDHPAFLTKSQFTPSGCQPPQEGEEDSIIGYEQGGGNDGTTTIAGNQGFMDEGGFTGEVCDY